MWAFDVLGAFAVVVFVVVIAAADVAVVDCFQKESAVLMFLYAFIYLSQTSKNDSSYVCLNRHHTLL